MKTEYATDRYDPDVSVVEDFARDVFCLFGLVVDRSAPEKTLSWLRQHRYRPGFPARSWATINVNWVAMSHSDQAFRRAILQSDHCTLDGRPLVSLAQKLSLRPGVVVQGSSTASWLNSSRFRDDPTTIAFFGGNDGVGQRAIDIINRDGVGLKGVGALNPGFVPLSELNEQRWMDAINELKPDLLSVALGARKGQTWLVQQIHRMQCGVAAHLGATVNFFAKDIRRAPRFVQALYLEWVWRILQEPTLFRRYWDDGRFFLKALRRIYQRWPLLDSTRLNKSLGEWESRIIDDHCEVIMPSHVGDKLVAAGRVFWPELLITDHLQRITIDFMDCQSMANEALAQLLLVAKHAAKRFIELHFTHINPQLRDQFEVSDVMESFKVLGVKVDD